jgi:hypothetical protein
VTRVAVFKGSFGAAEAERLLWRAGFGPRKGEAAALAARGLDGAVRALTRPGAEKLVGPTPVDEKGRPLAPYDAWGHDHVWWLDRMARTSRPLVERMALVWHDWFATSNDGVGSQRLMLQQNQLFRDHAFGSFDKLLLAVTSNPAMLLWLNGSDNAKWSPNENYAREMMELFTLGAGRGYGEEDVRQQARALTGFRNDWRSGVGPTGFRYDPKAHDTGVKTIFRKRGAFTWQDSVHLTVNQPGHPSFFVTKLWSYFVGTAPDAATVHALASTYAANKRAVRPVLEAILRHPALYEGPRLVKSPVVYTAGLLRRLDMPIKTTAYSWLAGMSGQTLFYPPNVAGWDDTRWLDTATWRGRWWTVQTILEPHALDPAKASQPFDAAKLLDGALEFWRRPALTDATRSALLAFAQASLADAGRSSWKKQQYPVMTQNALRHLIAVSPELQAA